MVLLLTRAGISMLFVFFPSFTCDARKVTNLFHVLLNENKKCYVTFFNHF